MSSSTKLAFSEVETFLDNHPDLFEDYLLRKGKHSTVEKWLKHHHLSKTPSTSSSEEKSVPAKECWATKRDGLQRRPSQRELRKSFARSKAMTANRTYDEHVNSRDKEPLSSMRRRALLRKASSLPPTTAHILSELLESRVNIPQYASTAIDYKYELKDTNEREFFLELVKDISNDLDLTSLSYKILIFVCILVDADRCSLFLVEGTSNKKTLVSKFFDVHAGTTVLPSCSMENSNEVQVPWGKGIIGYVAEHGETVSIPDAYQVKLNYNTRTLEGTVQGEYPVVFKGCLVEIIGKTLLEIDTLPKWATHIPTKDRRFRDEIDKLTGYKTKSLLCMPIRNSDGEIIGVAQAINKNPGGAAFTEDDEKVGFYFLFIYDYLLMAIFVTNLN